MAACAPTPTLTLFSTSISTTILTTYTVSVQTLPDGSVSSATVPLIVTSIITIVNPTSTLFASCPSSTPISTITYPSPSSYIPTPTSTVYAVTSTPSPVVVYVPKTTTLADGEVDVITVTSTSTPPATVVYVSTVITLSPTASPSKSSSNIVPIAGGAAGGFVFLIVIVATIWYILKKCRKPNTEREEEEVAFPFPVTRDRDQTRRLDLAKESRPYEYGVVGRSVPMSHSPPMASHSLTSASEGRRDSATPLIGTSFGALTPMPSSSLMTSNGAQTGAVDVGRQRSQSSTNHQLPPGAAAPVAALDHYSQSGSGGGGGGGGSASGSSISAGPSGRRSLQVANPRLSPTPAFGFFPENVPGSSSVPMAALGSEKQRFEAALQDLSSSSGPVIIHSDGGRVQPHDHRPSGSNSGEVPQSNPIALPATPEPTEAPPAYAE